VPSLRTPLYSDPLAESISTAQVRATVAQLVPNTTFTPSPCVDSATLLTFAKSLLLEDSSMFRRRPLLTPQTTPLLKRRAADQYACWYVQARRHSSSASRLVLAVAQTILKPPLQGGDHFH
jgi:hypothetical protein